MFDKTHYSILVIGSNQDLRENITELLEIFNFKVISAENGLIGLELAQKYLPDLILCDDMMLPEPNELDILIVIKNNPDIQHIPFIISSAKRESTDVLYAKSLGADDYLVKPYTEVHLLKIIRDHLKYKKVIEE